MDTVTNQNAGIVNVVNGKNPKTLHLHQVEAIKALNTQVLSQPFYEGLLVLPTGSGKTHTAVQWVLRNVIDKGQKVLWIAHRHELLNQALHAVKSNSYTDIMQNRKSFKYRVISGMHDRPVHLRTDDAFIIASKDSLAYGLPYLMDNWVVANKDNIFLVIDEAHHAVAKSYRSIINNMKEVNRQSFKVLGLTATPFRTSDNEKGLLKLIFKDDITYAVDLKTLINREILADPVFIDSNTQLDMTVNLTDSDIKAIHASDKLPREVAEAIALNKKRNSQIVTHYIQNQQKYGQTLVFALTIQHAIELKSVFEKHGVASDFVVSSIKDAFTGVTLSKEQNAEKLQAFKAGKLKVLINVNILTEGVDLPSVQAVFLTRPTISTILMTQMIGRALRGQKAGGTKQAYIVSFLDEWKDKIAWVNPRKLYEDQRTFTDESPNDKIEHVVRLIAISKIEEFARMMDETVDTSGLEKLNFIERIPVGLYSFSYLLPPAVESQMGLAGEETEQKYCDVMVYNTYKQAYEDFIADIDHLFDSRQLSEKEYLAEHELEYLSKEVEAEYFDGYDTTIGYKIEDIKDILRYYAQTSAHPAFLAFEERENYNVAKIASHIWNEDMGEKKKTGYLDQLWNDEGSFLRVFFGDNKKYFIQQINNELYKLNYGEEASAPAPEITDERIEVKQLSLGELRKRAPKLWRKLVNEVYEKSKDKDGQYCSASGEYRSSHKRNFQIDHIKPMSKGGLTEVDNLQLLTIKENMRKGNAYQEPDKGRNNNTEAKCADNSVAKTNVANKSFDQAANVDGSPSVGDDMDALLATIEEKVNNNDESAEALIEAGAEKFGSTKYYKNVGNYYSNAGLAEKAKEAYEKAITISDNPGEVEKTLFNLANLYFYMEDDFATGETYARQLMKLNPTSGLSYRLSAEIKNNNGDYQEALQSFDKAIAAGEDKAEMLLVKGFIMCENMAKPKEALGLYREAEKLRPDVDGINYYMGVAYYFLDKYKDALARLNISLLSENLERQSVYFYRAECYRLLGKYTDSIADYDQAIQLDPSDERSYYGKGSSEIELKKYAEACVDFDKAISAGRSDWEVYYWKGKCLQEMKQSFEAIEQFELSVAKDLQANDALFQLAYECDKKKLYPAAISHYNKYLSLDPNEIVALNNLGYTYQKMKNFPQALYYYNQALKIDPTFKLSLRNKEKLLKRINPLAKDDVEGELPTEESAVGGKKAVFWEALSKVFS